MRATTKKAMDRLMDRLISAVMPKAAAAGYVPLRPVLAVATATIGECLAAKGVRL